MNGFWDTAKIGINAARDVFQRGSECSRCQAIWILSIVLVIAAFTISGEMLEKLLTLIAGGAINMLGVGAGSKARGQGPEAPIVDPNASRS